MREKCYFVYLKRTKMAETLAKTEFLSIHAVKKEFSLEKESSLARVARGEYLDPNQTVIPAAGTGKC